MSVLGDREIKELMGKEIILYPFKRDVFLRGFRLCLTASRYAYSVSQENLLPIHSDRGKDYILLPARDTILCWTSESLLISDRICGFIHGRVSLVSKGIGHLGTTINPNWCGVLCISLQNNSDQNIQIRVADETESTLGDIIAYVTFHRLSSRSSIPPGLDDPGRLDSIPNGKRPEALNTWINDPQKCWRRGNKDALLELLKGTEDYSRLDREIKRGNIANKIAFIVRKFLPSMSVVILISVYIIFISQSSNELFLVLIPLIYTIVAEISKENPEQ